MKVLVTGAEGFIAKNLIVSLQRQENVEIIRYSKSATLADLELGVQQADFIFHLAGVNRPKNEGEFTSGNTELTQLICKLVKSSGQNKPILFSSSIQVESDNAYGKSKLIAETHLITLHNETGNLVYIYRLPNVFGKWCKPNYNSVVATFCHNIANDLPIQIHNSDTQLELVHIGAVVTSFLDVLYKQPSDSIFIKVAPVYLATLGELADMLYKFKQSRKTLITEPVGNGFSRVLYATYISYITPSNFNYSLEKHEDARGIFVEMLKTQNSGQFSFFTAHPGITRGGHYHQCKTEKFLVIKGVARFKFRHIITDEICEILVSGDNPEIVETIPGWSHDITNIGEDELIVMLWANENFDNERPDTVAFRV